MYQTSSFPIGARSAHTLRCSATTDLPCQIHDPDLWFADDPVDLEQAEALCASCPARLGCLRGAFERREVVGVWGGQLFDRGRVVTHKRPRGRPRQGSIAPRRLPSVDLAMLVDAGLDGLQV